MFEYIPLAVVIILVLFILGLLPIPVGYDRGKVKWLMWCGTGQHPMIVYRWPDDGFQTLHPDDETRTKTRTADQMLNEI